ASGIEMGRLDVSLFETVYQFRQPRLAAEERVKDLGAQSGAVRFPPYEQGAGRRAVGQATESGNRRGLDRVGVLGHKESAQCLDVLAAPIQATAEQPDCRQSFCLGTSCVGRVSPRLGEEPADTRLRLLVEQASEFLPAPLKRIEDIRERRHLPCRKAIFARRG